MPIYSPTGFLDITNATLRTSNTECQNLKIGTGNLYVTSEISPSFELNLSNVTSLGATSPHTLTLSNVTTAIDATSNIITSGNLKIGGLIYTKDWGIRTANGNSDNQYVGRFTVHGITEVLITDQGGSLGSASKFTITRNDGSPPLVNGIDSSSTVNYEWYYTEPNATTYHLWVRPIHSSSVQTNIKVTSSTYTEVAAPTSPTLIPCANGLINMSGNVVASQNLTVSGNVVASQNLTISGNTFYTSPMSVSVDSNVVTEYTGPHDRPLRKYPEVALTSASQGGYVASGSSNGSGSYPEYTAFDGVVTNSTTGWASDATYASGTGISTFSWNGSFGEYLSLELPKALRLQKMFLKGYEHSGINYQNAPRDIKLYGSNNETNWVLLKTETDLPIDSITNNSTYININATEYYKYIRLQITKTYRRTAGYTRISELEYYGHEEGSGSLDTTLKSVYNVPATTGTQLEVYYDAKDLDNGNAPTNPVNLSPNTNNATLGGDPQVSNGAFVFDGTGDYITGTHGLSVPGQPVHSQCVWFKITGDTSDYQYISIIGTTNSTNQAGLVLLNDGTTLLGNYYGGDRVITTITQNVWYHAVLVYTGTTTEAAKYYINGVEVITTGLSGAAPITPTITGTTVRLGANTSGGQELNGSIANFRLYSKALNADQVQELYDYQKDYFLGSKSQVTLYKGHLGVGVTEPSGQLELAGDERIQEYPPMAMTGWETYMEGHGVFRAGKSGHDDYLGAWDRWKVFNKGFTHGSIDSYHGEQSYSSSTGLYTGVGPQIESLGGILGDYFILDMPYKISLKHINLTSSNQDRSPTEFIILGSNDGSTWTQIKNFSSAFTGAGQTLPFQVNSNEYFSYFGLVVTKVVASGGYLMLSEWQLFGTPGPTTLDKGSLTLGRSLDVPRVSRYDVDTETPRPEKLVVDFDTTVNSSPTDISGKGHHGWFNGGAKYSAPDKAFKFDGNQDFIETRSGSNVISGSAPPFTASVWINYSGSEQGYVTPFSIEPDTYGTNTNVWFYIRDTTKKPTLQFDNNFVEFSEPGTSTGGATSNTWHHLAVSYNGSSAIGGRRCWLNGIEQVSSAVAGSGNLTLGTTRLTIGSMYYNNNHIHEMIGFISNFKLYNVALEPSEVQKLYRLGRTGRSMVISDTAVGIGKVPEAQLDVRGIIKGQSPAVFIAKANAAMTATAASAVAVFGSVITDTAGGWNSSNNRYYAKVPGFYLVNASQFTIITTNVYVVIRIDKNGVENSSTTGFAGPGGYPNTSLTALIYLSVGDYVSCRIGSDTNRTTASSHRLEIVHVGM